jgi:hypothetical protein
MAKYRRYRNYNRRSRPKWSANITHHVGEVIPLAAASTFFHTTVLSFNPIQTNTTVPQIFTVKNVEFNGTMEMTSANNNIENLCAFIMFVPQGMTITASYDIDHPEYIMAMKYYGSPSLDGQQQYQPLKVKTRLSRKLNTGDSIVLYLKGFNVGTTGTNLEYSGITRWWTKAN